MAHRTGFTEDSLLASLRGAGFAMAALNVHGQAFELLALATKRRWEHAELATLARRYLSWN